MDDVRDSRPDAADEVAGAFEKAVIDRNLATARPMLDVASMSTIGR